MPEQVNPILLPPIARHNEVRVRLLVAERTHPQQGCTAVWAIGIQIVGQPLQHCQGGLLTREQAAAVRLGDLVLQLALNLHRRLKALGAGHVTFYLHTHLLADSERPRLQELDEAVPSRWSKTAPPPDAHTRWTQVWDTFSRVAAAAGYTEEAAPPGRSTPPHRALRSPV